MIRFLRYSVLLLLAFFVLYIDSMGGESGETIRQIWKVPILIYMLYKGLGSFGMAFLKCRTWYAIVKLFNKDTLVAFSSNASICMKAISLPIFIAYISRRMNKKQVLKTLLFLSYAFIFSMVPYNLGIIEESHSYIGAEILGTKSLIGPFVNAHTASVVLACSALALLAYTIYIEMARIYKVVNFIILIIALYFLFLTYVRTGLLMVTVGVFFLFLPKRGLHKRILYGLVFFAIAYGSIHYLISENVIFKQRMLEQNQNNVKGHDEKVTGNGRLYFWYTSYQLWYNSQDLQHYLFGYGFGDLSKEQEKQNGLTIGSHNGFIDALTQNGLVGLTLLSLYYILLFRFNLKYRKSRFFQLFLAWFMMDLSFQMVQGGVFIFYDFMSALIIMLPKLDMDSYKEGKKEKEKLYIRISKRYKKLSEFVDL